ncbi:hypothetical protein [Micromonospora zamorensis]|uniref:hypothetical protein n=1 Tax=Micromonospora zamorensis TaxID=709883 RepID=UPI003CE8D8FB
MDAVLVLNADLGPLHRVPIKHAIRMLMRQVAEIHEAEPDRLTIGACYACNQRKGDLTPAEAGMQLRFQPPVPTWSSTMRR